MQTIHLFEQAGLGQAPYEYLYCVDAGRAQCSCQFCSTSIRYKFYLKSADGKTFFVGSDCIYKSGDACLTNIAKAERSRIAKEQRESKRQAQIEANRLKRQAFIDQRKEEFLTQHENIAHVFDWAKTADGIPQQMMNGLNTWGFLSDKQVELLCRLFNDVLTVKNECPSGKVTIEGKICSIKLYEDYYRSSVLKMLVESSEGYRVFGTLPSGLHNAEIGDQVKFIATVEPSPKDAHFGFFSRPSKAEKI